MPRPAGGAGDASGEYDPFAQQSRPQTLQDHLAWQLNLTKLGPRDRAVAEALIDAIDANGYLRLELEDLLESLGDDELELDEIEAVLHRIQSFDPPGVGARDPRECLLLQLRQLPPDEPFRDDAIRICESHFAPCRATISTTCVGVPGFPRTHCGRRWRCCVPCIRGQEPWWRTSSPSTSCPMSSCVATMARGWLS
jgi:DNA-directed RNA polymerase specialized sigma54-like protein